MYLRHLDHFPSKSVGGLGPGLFRKKIKLPESMTNYYNLCTVSVMMMMMMMMMMWNGRRWTVWKIISMSWKSDAGKQWRRTLKMSRKIQSWTKYFRSHADSFGQSIVRLYIVVLLTNHQNSLSDVMWCCRDVSTAVIDRSILSDVTCRLLVRVHTVVVESRS